MSAKKPVIKYLPIRGSGLLSIFWKQNSKTLAVDSLNGFGIEFFDDDGSLIGVEFFDVEEKSDRQELKFKNHVISILMKDGVVKECQVKNSKVA